MRSILIIDDDPTTVTMLSKRLMARGYNVLSSLEADVGLQMAMRQNPDLVLLDVMMPMVNGYNICRLLKSSESHRHIPVVLLTGRTTEEDKKIGQEVGADAYLPKPVDMPHLIETIQALCPDMDRGGVFPTNERDG